MVRLPAAFLFALGAVRAARFAVMVPASMVPGGSRGKEKSVNESAAAAAAILEGAERLLSKGWTQVNEAASIFRKAREHLFASDPLGDAT